MKLSVPTQRTLVGKKWNVHLNITKFDHGFQENESKLKFKWIKNKI